MVEEKIYVSFSCTLFEKFKFPSSNTTTDVINQIRTKSWFNLSRAKQLLGNNHRANLTPRSHMACRRGLEQPQGGAGLEPEERDERVGWGPSWRSPTSQPF